MAAAARDEAGRTECPEPFAVRLDRLLELVLHQVEARGHRIKSPVKKRAR